MLLEHKNAVVYGAGGAVGGAAVRAFAREGEHVFLVGRTAATLSAVADDIRAAGGEAEVAEVDALDQNAVENHLDEVMATAGSVDISFNAVSLGDVQTQPLVDMSMEDFLTPITTAARAYFVTATAAARRMIAQGSGVIVTLSSSAARLSGPRMVLTEQRTPERDKRLPRPS